MCKESRNSICPECGSYRVTYEHTDDYDWQLCTCGCCGCSGTPDEFFHNSVFARITSSPEVLAPHFVFLKAVLVTNLNPKQQWISTLTGEVYPTKPEAIAATVAKLKEVCNE